MKLDHLFSPRAIAVVGATGKAGRVGRIIFETLLRSERPVYPVHRSESNILGQPVFNSVENLPSDVDLAVIAVGAEATVEIAKACGRANIPFIIPIAGGFSETGDEGRKLEERLGRVAQDYSTLCGDWLGG